VDASVKGGPGTAWGLIDGFVGWSATVAALDLGLFEALAQRPDGLGASALAELCGARPDRLETLCRQLISVGFLSLEDDRYRLVPSAPLRHDEAGYLGDLLRLSPGRALNWLGLAGVIRGDDPAEPVDDAVDGFHAPLARATFRLQRSVAADLPAALALDTSAALRVVDVGAGAGAWSTALLECAPAATAVLVDRAGLLAVARSHLERETLLDRAELVDWDLDAGSLPSPVLQRTGSFDLVVLAHVLRHLATEDARALVAHASGLLRPGGTVVVAEYLLEGEATSERAVAIDLITLANARAWHLTGRSDLCTWLAQAGFEEPADLGLSPVFSVLAARLPAEAKNPANQGASHDQRGRQPGP